MFPFHLGSLPTAPATSFFSDLPWEALSESRKMLIMADIPPQDSPEVPLVRSTMSLQNRTWPWTREIADLAKAIETAFSVAPFNNVMVEDYTAAYSTMKWHSDQAQDLEPASHIALLSFDEEPRGGTRVLHVKEKAAGGAMTTLALGHLSVVLFSVEDNARFLHRITGQKAWRGITFRRSRTRVKFVQGAPMVHGQPLRLCETPRLIHRHRAEENSTDGPYEYPAECANLTLSPGDLASPFS